MIVTAGAPFIPEELLKQLKPNGIMVIPVDMEEDVQEMIRITRREDNVFEKESFGKFRFVPMLSNKARD